MPVPFLRWKYAFFSVDWSLFPPRLSTDERLLFTRGSGESEAAAGKSFMVRRSIDDAYFLLALVSPVPLCSPLLPRLIYTIGPAFSLIKPLEGGANLLPLRMIDLSIFYAVVSGSLVSAYDTVLMSGAP